jgi:hypothetical protein
MVRKRLMKPGRREAMFVRRGGVGADGDTGVLM